MKEIPSDQAGQQSPRSPEEWDNDNRLFDEEMARQRILHTENGDHLVTCRAVREWLFDVDDPPFKCQMHGMYVLSLDGQDIVALATVLMPDRFGGQRSVVHFLQKSSKEISLSTFKPILEGRHPLEIAFEHVIIASHRLEKRLGIPVDVDLVCAEKQPGIASRYCNKERYVTHTKKRVRELIQALMAEDHPVI